MSTLKQPVVGIVATVLMMAVALGFVSLFSFQTFTGWVAYFLLCAIPMQIVAAVTWGANPGFVATQAQPAKGILLTLTTLVVGVVVSALCYFTIGGQVSPPTPMLAMFSIVSVVITFWLAIMWGGWPLTGIVKNPVAAGLLAARGRLLDQLRSVPRVLRLRLRGRTRGEVVAAQDPHGLFPA